MTCELQVYLVLAAVAAELIGLWLCLRVIIIDGGKL